MSELENLRREFEEALEGLKEVHTKEELEEQKRKVDKLKNEMLKVDEQFRLQFETRREAMRLKHLQRRVAVMQEKHEAMKILFTPIARARNHRKDETLLACPQCGATNVNWLVVNRKTARKLRLPKVTREIPWCLKCKVRMVKMTREKMKRLRRKNNGMG